MVVKDKNKIMFMLSILFYLLQTENNFAAISRDYENPYKIPQKEVEIYIQNKNLIQQETIVLGQVAKIYVKKLQDFNLISNMVLAKFPSGQNVVTVPGNYIKDRIKEILKQTSPNEIQLDIPEKIEFQRISNILSREDIIQKIYTQALELQKIPSFIELHAGELVFDNEIIVPQGSRYEVEAAIERPEWRGMQSFKLKIINDKGETTEQHWIKTKLLWFAEAWKATKDIKYRQALNSDYFEKTKVDVTNIYAPLVICKDKQELEAKLNNSLAKTPLSANAVLTEQALERRPDAVAGQETKVIFTSNNIKVTALGSLLSNATIGDKAKVKIKKTKRVFEGTLVDNSLVEVKQ